MLLGRDPRRAAAMRRTPPTSLYFADAGCQGPKLRRTSRRGRKTRKEGYMQTALRRYRTGTKRPGGTIRSINSSWFEMLSIPYANAP